MNKLLIIFLAFALGVNAQTTQGSTTFDTGAVVDGKLAGKFVVKGGTAAPSSGDCDALAEVGSIYLRSDDPATNPSVSYRCLQTGASSYAWDLMNVTVGTTAPATCVVGQMFFDSDATAGSNLFGCTAANTWTALGGGGSAGNTHLTHTILDETWDGGNTTSNQVGRGQWYIPAGTLANGDPALSGLNGTKLFTSAATSGSNSAVFSSSMPRSAMNPAKDGGWFRYWELKWMQTDSTVTQANGLHCGSGLSTTNPDQQIAFRRYPAGSNWFAITQTTDGSAETETDTGIAISTNRVKFEISRASSGANIIFKINDSQVASHSTNIPTQWCQDWVLVMPAENVAKTVYLDHFHKEDPRP